MMWAADTDEAKVLNLTQHGGSQDDQKMKLEST